jgi:hypothetical protein
MAGAIGKAFKISKRDAKGYDYVEPRKGRGYQRNPGVTAIAAINGPGAYERSRKGTARAAMSGLSQNQRRRRAAQLTRAEREAFSRRMQQAKKRKAESMLSANMRRNKSRQVQGRINIKRAQAARREWGRKAPAPGSRIRVGRAYQKAKYGTKAPKPKKLAPGLYTTNRRRSPTTRRGPMLSARSRGRRVVRRPMRRNRQTPAQRRASMRNLRKARAALKPNRRRAPARRKAPARRRAAARRAPARRRPAMRRNRKQTAAQRRASLRNLRKARAARMKPNRRRAPAKRRTAARRKPMRRNRKQTAAQRRASLRNIRKAHAKLRRNKRRSPVRRRKPVRRAKGYRKNARRRVVRRRVTRRKPMRRNRQTAAQRRASLRNLRKARSAQRRRGSYRSNRRRATSRKRRTRRSKGLRRNRRTGLFRKLFRRNQGVTAALKTAFKSGLTLTAGFAAHKALTHLISGLIADKMVAAAPPVAPEVAAEPEATTGLGALAAYSDLISGTLTAIVGIIAVQKLVKDNDTKMLLAGGMATSLLHTALVTVLRNVGQDTAADYLSGSDGTAARLSAMYGLGTDVPRGSIQPMYAPAAGLGQPILQAAAGMGQPILQAAAGPMGEYFESGVEGLGNYTGNPEIMQAAAGFGQAPEIEGPHIDPSSDLDRELSIAEAAAGVGEYFDSGVSGLGDFYGPGGTIGRSQTWIPGQSDPSIWAGTRPVSRPQAATAMTTAGILQAGGGAGILG